MIPTQWRAVASPLPSAPAAHKPSSGWSPSQRSEFPHHRQRHCRLRLQVLAPQRQDATKPPDGLPPPIANITFRDDCFQPVGRTNPVEPTRPMRTADGRRSRTHQAVGERPRAPASPSRAERASAGHKRIVRPRRSDIVLQSSARPRLSSGFARNFHSIRSGVSADLQVGRLPV